MEVHSVPVEERAVDEKGNRLPWAYVYSEYVDPIAWHSTIHIFRQITNHRILQSVSQSTTSTGRKGLFRQESKPSSWIHSVPIKNCHPGKKGRSKQSL